MPLLHATVTNDCVVPENIHIFHGRSLKIKFEFENSKLLRLLQTFKGVPQKKKKWNVYAHRCLTHFGTLICDKHFGQISLKSDTSRYNFISFEWREY